MLNIETKRFGGHVVEVKASERNGVPVGILAGHMALWTPDRGGKFGVPDVFTPGAFTESLAEHKARRDRQVRFKDNHGRVIGGSPIDGVFEDQIGLFGSAEVNLETQLGREAYSLAKQKVLVDFSVGFTALEDVIENGLRTISKAILWETSITDEPVHKGANIDEVKSVVGFQDLDLAPRLTTWNQAAAKERIRVFTKSKEIPTTEYKAAFVWIDDDKIESYSGYRLQIADIIEEKMVAVPRAIFKVANEIANRSATIPEPDLPAAVKHLEQYYLKMGLVSPFNDEDKRFFGAEEIKKFTRRDLETALIESKAFSRSAAIGLASKFEGYIEPGSEEALLAELMKIKF